jgi:TorA-specific chaperone
MNERLPGDADTIPAAFVYRWMAGLYLAPLDAAGLAAYRSHEGRALLERLAQVPALAPVVAELAALTGPDSDLDAAAGRLAAAHAAAFLVGGRRGAPPYASVWLSDRGLMYQEPARAMTRLLAAAGLTLPEDVPEPPDHISFQLNLLAELDERHRAGDEAPLAPDAFVRDHMLTWLPDFATAAARLRDPLLFAALAEATLGYLTDKA